MSQAHGVVKAAHATTADESGDLQLAGMSRHLMTFLQLADQLILAEVRLKLGAVGHVGEIEGARAQHPPSGISLGRCAITVAPGVRRVVEGPRIDDRPVQEVVPRIVRILVALEDVADRQLAGGQHQAIGGLGTAELVQV